MHIYFSAVAKAILTFYLLFTCFMHFCVSAGVRVTLAENSKRVFMHICLFFELDYLHFKEIGQLQSHFCKNLEENSLHPSGEC